MPTNLSRTVRLSVLATVVAMGGIAMAVTATPSSAATCNGYVGLTFDDGPTGSTTTLLNVLRTNGVRATMFNVGQNVQNNRSAAQAQVAAGMWVANHAPRPPAAPPPHRPAAAAAPRPPPPPTCGATGTTRR